MGPEGSHLLGDITAGHSSTVVLVRELPPVVSHYRQSPLGYNIDMSSPHDTWIDHKCLVYWKAGLDVTQRHTITYGSEKYFFEPKGILLDSFDVLRVEGGTRYKP